LALSPFLLSNFDFVISDSFSSETVSASVAQLVFFIRGEKVMFDADLAMLYGVEVRSLNQAVARNRKRFPADFAFQLTDDELAALRSQLVISKSPTSQAGSRLLNRESPCFPACCAARVRSK
jgi:hypothetical protein